MLKSKEKIKRKNNVSTTNYKIINQATQRIIASLLIKQGKLIKTLAGLKT